MTLDLSRRSFLKGLLATTVVVSMPKAAAEALKLDPAVLDEITPPPGVTYMWVRTALMGTPDPENVEKRLKNGWKFVEAAQVPRASTATLEHAIEAQGLVLMEKPTAQVETQQAEVNARLRGQGRLPGRGGDLYESAIPGEGLLPWWLLCHRQRMTCCARILGEGDPVPPENEAERVKLVKKFRAGKINWKGERT